MHAFQQEQDYSCIFHIGYSIPHGQRIRHRPGIVRDFSSEKKSYVTAHDHQKLSSWQISRSASNCITLTCAGTCWILVQQKKFWHLLNQTKKKKNQWAELSSPKTAFLGSLICVLAGSHSPQELSGSAHILLLGSSKASWLNTIFQKLQRNFFIFGPQ